MKSLKFVIPLCFTVSSAFAEDGPLKATYFLDSYYAVTKDSNGPDARPYTTQELYQNDPRFNLGMAGLEYKDNGIRAKIVGQFGDSVDSNYSSEPHQGFRYLQESYVGYELSKDSYIDVGTFLSHIGAESWISKDNPTYSRSLIAEYSPYYQTGARFVDVINDEWSYQIHLLNGWQNTTDKRHPALGTQLKWQEDESFSITSNIFLGDEQYGTRAFHDLILTKAFSDTFSTSFSVDVGYQDKNEAGSAAWWGSSLVAQQKLSDEVSVNARLESFSDTSGVVATSITSDPFRMYGASIGADYLYHPGVLFRAELKQNVSPYKIFQDKLDEVRDDTVFLVSINLFDSLEL